MDLDTYNILLIISYQILLFFFIPNKETLYVLL